MRDEYISLKKKKYLVAVMASDGKEIFEFESKEARDAFIKDVKERGIEYMTSETT